MNEGNEKANEIVVRKVSVERDVWGELKHVATRRNKRVQDIAGEMLKLVVKKQV